MLIHVRRRHIERGRPESPSGCPIALAIRQQFDIAPPRVDVSVYGIVLGYTSFDCPTIAQRFIARFDAGKPVKPFAFVLK